jgi:hypothetical protein
MSMKGFLASAALALISTAAWSYSVTPTGGDATLVSTSNNQGGGENDLIEAWNLANDPDVVFQYKDNVGGAEEGPFTGSYETTYSDTETDPQNALIEYISGPSLTCPTCLLIVKDGNQIPAVYLFSLVGWNGTDDLVLTGFWPGEGAISHVSLYSAASSSSGGGSGSGTIPEPASSGLALVGLGLMLAALRLRVRRS